MQSMPLRGVRVLDLSNLIAGPMSAMYLADFGAEVIKVEHPQRGDEMRRWGLNKNGVGLYFKVINRNKKTITLDLKSPKGQELIKRMVPKVDVVIESFRPGTLERWNIGYEQLREINDRIIMLRVSGYGQTGPYSHRPGFGTIGEAISGAAYITGEPDRPPLLPAFGLGDASTAIHAAYAVMVALYNRDVNGGKGQYIDLGLYEGLFTLLGPQVINYDQLGVIQERDGSRLPFVAPRNTYQTADGAWIAIAGSTQATFERTAKALEIEHIIDDPRFIDNASRLKNVEELDKEIQAGISKFTLKEALERLEQAGAPAGPCYNIKQIFEDEHFQARGNIATIPDEELGQVRMQNVVPRLSETPGRIVHAGPPKGKYNREIYVDWLGLSEEEFQQLVDEGVI